MSDRRASMRLGLEAQPRLLHSDAFDKRDFPEGISLKQFHQLRWADVDAQLAKISEDWDGLELIYAMITVQVGASDFKKIGLELRPQDLSHSPAQRMASIAHRAKVEALLKGKSGKSGGDMDDMLEVNSKAELCAAEIKKKSFILQQEVTLIHASNDGSSSTSKGSCCRHSASSASTTAPSGQASESTASSSSSSPRPDRNQLEQHLAASCQVLKDNGLTLDDAREMLTRIWEDLSEPPRRSEAGSAGTSQAARRTTRNSQGSESSGEQELISALRLTRESPNLAYCTFHFEF